MITAPARVFVERHRIAHHLQRVSHVYNAGNVLAPQCPNPGGTLAFPAGIFSAELRRKSLADEVFRHASRYRYARPASGSLALQDRCIRETL
jgi:hypothetical protein